jgi:predicted nucleic acid-binding Zn ribbon protein
VARPPETAVEDSLCPSCSAILPAGAKVCPECGEVLTPEAVEIKRGLGGRMSGLLFWSGLGLVIIGGPGLALGSWLHDVLAIPIGGNAFEVFGQFNRFVSATGLIVLIVGIVLLIVSIKFTRPVIDEDYDIGTPKRA